MDEIKRKLIFLRNNQYGCLEYYYGGKFTSKLSRIYGVTLKSMCKYDRHMNV